MCGIVGIISAYTNGFSGPEAESFQRMLFLDTMRGWDSTGVFGADKHKNVGILKEASMAPVFMQTKEFKEWNSKLISSGMFAVGHNRAATRGTVKDENAHPFWVENNIVLVQNGTYFGDHKHLKDTEVDTEAIAHVIHEEDDVTKALSRINSAYALVWYNIKENSLNIIRNQHRPLYVCYTASGAMLFASEEETLKYAIGKAGWKVKNDPYLIKEDNLIKLTFDEKGGHSSENIPISHTKSYFPVVVPESKHVGRHVGYVKPTVVEEVRQSPSPFRGSESPVALTAQFFDVFPGNTTEYDLSSDDIKPLQALYLDLVKAGKKVLVETQDYFPANQSRNCRVWHIVATILSPNSTLLEKVALHWTITNKDETETYEYTAKQSWFELSLGNLIISKFGNRFIARAYCTDVTPVNTINVAHA